MGKIKINKFSKYSIVGLISAGVITAALSGISAQVQAASPAAWSATSSTSCPAQGAGSALVTVGTLVYEIAGGGAASFASFNPTTQTCTALADFPQSPSDDVTLESTDNNTIYAHYNGQIYKYLINLDDWITFDQAYLDDANGTAVSNSGATQGDGNAIVSYNGEEYVIAGNSTTFEKYNSGSNSWTTLEVTPSAVGQGAALAVHSTNIYAFRGAATTTFWQFNGTSWSEVAAAPQTVNYGGALATVGTKVYALRGGNYSDFWSYDTSGNSWSTSLTRAPGYVNAGGALVAIGTDLYAFQGGSKNFWKYDTTGNTWNQTLAQTPQIVYGGASLATDGTDIYAILGGNAPEAWKYTVAGDTWSQLEDVPSNVGNASITDAQGGLTYDTNVLYAVSGKGVTGTATTGRGTIWRFPLTGNNINTWPYRTFAPASMTGSGAGQSLAYPASGNFLYYLAGNGTQDFFKFSILNDSWIPWTRPVLDGTNLISQTTPSAITEGTGNAIVQVGDLFYVAPGNNSVNFLQFNQATNKWKQLTDLPIGATSGFRMVEADSNTIYAIYSTYTLKYNISQDTWQAGFPLSVTTTGEIYSQAGANQGNGNSITEVNGKLYIIPANNSTSIQEFDPTYNTWTTLSAAPAGFNSGASLATVGTDIYALQGANSLAFYKFDTLTNIWTTLTSVDAGLFNVEEGGSLVYPGSGDYLYALKGNGSTEFWRYSIAGNSWLQMTDSPAAVTGGGALTWLDTGVLTDPSDDTLFAFRGGATTDFWSYNISANTWDTTTAQGATLAAAPETITQGATLATYDNNTSADSSDDLIYATRGYGTKTFWAYDPVANIWTYKTQTPSVVGNTNTTTSAGKLVSSTSLDNLFLVTGLGDNGTIYYSADGGLVFRYDPATNTWPTSNFTKEASFINPPAQTGTGASLAYPGTGDLFYAIAGYGTNYFWSYNKAIEEWNAFTKSILADGNPISQYGSDHLDGTDIIEVDNIFYIAAANGTAWESYDPGTNTWKNLAAFPQSTPNQISLLQLPTDADTIYALFPGASITNFWKYTISTNQWEAMPDDITNPYITTLIYPGAGDWIYTIAGNSPAWNSTDLWRYSISKELWVNFNRGKFDGYVNGNTNTNPTPISQNDSESYVQTSGNTIAEANGKLYILAGGSQTFEEFDPSTNVWTALTDIPVSATFGSSLAWDGSDKIYAFNGGSTNFYSYNITAGTWDTLAAAPVSTSSGATLAFPSTYGNYVFALGGNNSTGFYAYDIAGGSWSTLSSTPGNQYGGASLVFIDATQAYATGGGATSNFWTFGVGGSAPEGTWTDLTSSNPPPASIKVGAKLVTDGTNLFTTRGAGTTTFYKYAPTGASGSRWSEVANAPDTIGEDSSGGHIGGSAYIPNINEIWTTPGNGRASREEISGQKLKGLLFRYKVATNEWPYYAAATNSGMSLYRPASSAAFGTSVVVDHNLYFLAGQNTTTFKKYTIENKSGTPDRAEADPGAGEWEAMPPLPVISNGPLLTADDTYLYGLIGYGKPNILKFDTTTQTPARFISGLATAITTNANYDPTLWAQIKRGYFRITLDTVVQDIYDIDFTSVTTMAEVASTIQAAIRSITSSTENVYWCTDFSNGYFVFESATPAGSSGAVSTMTYPISEERPLLTGGTGALSNAATWAAITDGSFRITSNGTQYDVTGIDFTAAESMSVVASTIQAAYRAATSGSTETVLWSTDHFELNPATTATQYDQNITVLSSVGSGTDISTPSYMDANSTNGTVTEATIELSGQSGGFAGTMGTSGTARAETTIGDWTYCQDQNVAPDAPYNLGDTSSGSSIGGLFYSSSRNEIWVSDGLGDHGNILGDSPLLLRFQVDSDTGTAGDQNAWPTYEKPATVPNILGGGGSMTSQGTDTLYALRGTVSSGGATSTDFWEYDIGANTWTDRSGAQPTPNAVGPGGTIQSDGASTLYATRGNATADFWSYNTITNEWTDLTSTAPVPTVVGWSAASNSGADSIFYNNALWLVPGLGTSSVTETNTGLLYRYSTASGSWPQETDPADATSATNGFLGGSDLVSNSDGSLLYALQGSISTSNSNFWEYNTAADAWTAKADMPSQTPSGAVADVESGGTLEYNNTQDLIYGLRGKATADFQTYDVGTNIWSYTAGYAFPTNVGTAVTTSDAGALAFMTSTKNLFGIPGISSSTIYTIILDDRATIESINSGTDPNSFTAFPVTVQSTDIDGNPFNVSTNTNVELTKEVGTGTLGGTTTGTILSGTSSIVLPSVTYDTEETGVILRVTDTAPGTMASTISATFNVTGPPPTIVDISPSTGTTTGGSTITITGTDFDDTPTVTFGGISATSVVYVSSTELTVVTPKTSPAGTAGAVDVVVTNLDAATDTATNGFTYSGPVITSITPDNGVEAGGTAVTISGNYFAAGGYQMPIVISNGGDALSNFQISITLDTATPIGEAKMQTDCSDLRVKDTDGSSDLPYYIESGCNSASTIIWTKVPTIAATPTDTTIYVTYSDSSLADAQDGDSVFEFFDDFSSGPLNTAKWTQTTGTPNNGTTPDGDEFANAGYITLEAGEGLYGGSYAIPADTILETSVSRGAANGFGGPIRASVTPNAGFVSDGGANILDILWWNSSMYGETNSSESAMGTWTSGTRQYRITYRPTGAADGTAIFEYFEPAPAAQPTLTVTKVGANTAGTLYPVIYYHGSGSDNPQWDYYRVRKYAATVPVATPGSEEIVGNVTFGINSATDITIVSSTTITATAPAGSGAVNVTVTNSDSLNATIGYTYNAIPTISGISPTSGGNDQTAYTVTISGTNFLSGITAKIQKAAESDINCTNIQNFTAISFDCDLNISAATLGLWSVKIVNPDTQNATLTNGFEITIPPPTVDTINLPAANVLTDLALSFTTTPSSARGIINWLKDQASIAVLNMPFEEVNSTTSDNALDYSGYGNNGSEMNGLTWNATSGLGSTGAYDFDGSNDYIEVPSATELKYTGGDMTLSAWVYVNSSDSDGGYILSKAWNGGGQYNYYLKYNNLRQITFQIFGDSTYLISTTEAITADAWHYVVASVNTAKDMSIYFDGDLKKSETHTITGWTPSGGDGNLKVTIGTLYPYGEGWGGNSTFTMNGSLDEVQIFNQALSPQQISALYNAGTPDYSALVSQETAAGEDWQACVTPNNGTLDGTAVCSNEITVTPTVDTATLPAATTDEDLALSFQTTPLGARGIINWLKNQTSITVVNMPFEGNNGSEATSTLDYSDSGNNGTVNGATWSASGGVDGGGAYTFNGNNDYISISGTIQDGDVSMFAWIYQPDTSSTQCVGSRCTVISIPGNNLFEVFNNHVYIYGYNWNTPGWVTAYNVITAGAWHQVGFTYNQTALRIYVDGIDVGGDNNRPGSMRSMGTVNIGALDTDVTRYFNGSIDEVMILNNVLSPQQITAMYNAGTPNYTAIAAQETASGEDWQACITPNSGTLDGAELCSNEITVTYGTSDIATSTFVAGSTSVVANGVTESTLTATIRDADNSPVENEVVTVAKSAGIGTPYIQAVNCSQTDVGSITKGTTNASGQACFIVRSDTVTTSGTDTFQGTITSIAQPITQTATVEFTADLPNLDDSTFAESPSTVTADGATTSTLTATLTDFLGNAVSGVTIGVSDDSVGNVTYSPISQTEDTISSGVADFTVTSETAETVVFTSSIQTSSYYDNLSYTETTTAGAFINDYDGTESTLIVGSQGDDTETTTTLPFDFELFGTNVTAGSNIYVCSNGFISLASSGCSSSGSLTNAISGFFRDLTTAGGGIYREVSSDSNSVRFLWDAQDVGTSSPIFFEIILYQNNRIDFHYFANAGLTARIGLYDAAASVAPDTASTFDNGVFANTSAAKFENPSAAAPANLSQTSSVEFTAGAVVAANSTVEASQAAVDADGVTTSTITVTVLDQFSNPVPSRTIKLTDDGSVGQITYDPSSQDTTDASGIATFNVTSTTIETFTFTATDITSGSVALGTVEVQFTCILNTSQQCVQIKITPSAGVLTITAPDNFTFPSTTSSNLAQNIFSTDSLTPYTLNTNDVITVTDTEAVGGFTLQLQSSAFQDPATLDEIPLTGFYAITQASDTGGTQTSGVEYNSGYSGVTNITASQNNATAGALDSATTFTTNGDNLDSAIDLMLAPVTIQEIGRSGLFKQNVEYYLLIPSAQEIGNYTVTLTFDLTRTSAT